MSNAIYDVQLMDLYPNSIGALLSGSGGKAIICAAGTYKRLALVNPDAGFVTLAQPVALTRGKLRFAVYLGASGQALPPVVDIYLVTPGGRSAVIRNASPGAPSEIYISTNSRLQTMIMPFSISDMTAATEFDTGIDFMVGSVILPQINVNTRTIEASKTLSVGLLATPTGLVNGASVAVLGTHKTTMATGAVTKGSLLIVVAGGAAANIAEEYVIAAVTRLSFQLSSGSTLGEGFVEIPYLLPSN